MQEENSGNVPRSCMFKPITWDDLNKTDKKDEKLPNISQSMTNENVEKK